MACILRDGGCCKKNRVGVRGLFLDTRITQQEIMKWANSIEIRKCKPRNEYRSDGIYSNHII